MDVAAAAVVGFGVLADLAPDLRVGEAVGRQQQMGVFIDPSAWEVETYLTDAEVERVAREIRGKMLLAFLLFIIFCQRFFHSKK